MTSDVVTYLSQNPLSCPPRSSIVLYGKPGVFYIKTTLAYIPMNQCLPGSDCQEYKMILFDIDIDQGTYSYESYYGEERLGLRVGCDLAFLKQECLIGNLKPTPWLNYSI